MLVYILCALPEVFPFRGRFWPPFRFSLTQSGLAASLNFFFSICYSIISSIGPSRQAVLARKPVLSQLFLQVIS
jgi:hypothetical protein